MGVTKTHNSMYIRLGQQSSRDISIDCDFAMRYLLLRIGFYAEVLS